MAGRPLRGRRGELSRSPELIGHRGAPRERPENTLASFLRALDLGADGIELDVQAVGLERQPERELHVRRRELDPIPFGADEDPREHLHRRTSRDGARDDRQRRDQLVLGRGDLHRSSETSFYLNH